VPPLLPIVGLLSPGVGWLVRDALKAGPSSPPVVIVAFFATLFLNLYPTSDLFGESTLTSRSWRARHTLHAEVMSWVALIFTPLVLLYQSWTYWIFKKA